MGYRARTKPVVDGRDILDVVNKYPIIDHLKKCGVPYHIKTEIAGYYLFYVHKTAPYFENVPDIQKKLKEMIQHQTNFEKLRIEAKRLLGV